MNCPICGGTYPHGADPMIEKQYSDFIIKVTKSDYENGIYDSETKWICSKCYEKIKGMIDSYGRRIRLEQPELP